MMGHAKLTTQQTTDVLNAVRNSSFKELFMSGVDFSLVPLHLVKESFSNLKNFVLYENFLDKMSVVEIKNEGESYFYNQWFCHCLCLFLQV